MPGSQVTLQDVARAAGVSRTTASLVLSDRGTELRISEVSQERVRRVASELGYRPNKISATLRSGRSRTIGFVSDTVATSQLAGDMIKGAIEGARRHDHMLFIGESEGDAREQGRLIETMLDHQVDGLILASMFTRERVLPRGLSGKRVVLLNALDRSATPRFPSVVPDEFTAGREAARALLTAGHDRIHLIGAGPRPADVPPDTVAGRERLAGILAELAGNGLAPASGRTCNTWLPFDGWRATADLLGSGVMGGAIIAFNDRLAFGAYQAIQEAGLSVPEDFSIVSFDDHQLAGWLRPALTTFALPHHELGRRAVELLLDPAVDGEPLVERLAMPLRVRDSLGAPSARH